ncbi:MAG: hypothetical protein FWE57_03745 [Chitinispirillia bacterium]|nr:hypothetical protein [Chitinispirillia bacterium]
MLKLKVTILAALAAVFAIGCGNASAPAVKEGDLLEVITSLPRERFEAAYGDLENPGVALNVDGSHVEIEAGTVLKVLVTPKDRNARIEVIPVKIGDLTSDSEIRDHIVPERFREFREIRGYFLYYSFSLDPEYLGNQVKIKN